MPHRRADEQPGVAVRVSVIVPVLNAGATIGACLASILDQSYPKSLTEVIVVDGGSTDGTVATVEGLPVKLICKVGNAATAINTGADLASGEVLLLADADAYYPSRWIESHINGLGSPGVTASGGPCLTWDRGGLVQRLIGYELESRYTRLPPRVGRISTMNLAILKDVFRSVGGMCGSLDVAYDTEFGYRLQEHGHAIIVNPMATAYHAHRNDFKAYLQQQYRYAQALPSVFKKHPSALKGDSVTSGWMNLQPLFLVTLLVFGGLGILLPLLLVPAALMGALLAIILTGQVVKAVLASKKVSSILATSLLVARMFAWTFGVIAVIAKAI